MDLAAEADVSARHLSFVETGRSKPSRELVLELAECMDVPLRERNALLLAAGYAPVYPQTPLEGPAMTPVREALDKLLSGHEPFPAVVVDRRRDIVSANRPALALVSEGLAPELVTPVVNALRVNLHPKGMAPRILNLPVWRAHLLARLRREISLTADPDLQALYEELEGYPGGEAPVPAEAQQDALFVPLRIRSNGHDLAFFSTIATFGTPLDVTMSELSMEAFYPADASTAAYLREAWL
jgi:hypothetical protein